MATTKHGLYAGLQKKEYFANMPREHKAWMSMKRRVAFPKNECYKKISICDQWLNSYESFLKDMGNAPSDNHQIDRIDNSLGYTPGNCRWLTHTENQRNKTNNHMIEWNGKLQCLAAWTEELKDLLGLTRNTLSERLRRNWTIERAFTTVAMRNKSKNHGKAQS